MTFLAYLVMFAWIPAVLLIFASSPPRRAAIVAFVLAWLFLPRFGLPLPGLPDYTKSTATSMGVLLGAVLFDLGGLAAFRPRWPDIPMVVWCLCPFASSVTNGLGAYDGVSACVNHIFTFGLPYFIGRVYLGGHDGVRDLAVGFVMGGLIYIPLCLFEIRMSPQLHRLLYGGADSSVALRYGGYRPSVFMINGLEVGMWMTGASLLGCRLWAGGVVKQISGVSFGRVLLPALVATAVLCKSTGAILQMILGLVVLWVSRRLRTALPALALAAIAPLYCGLRASGMWDGRVAVAVSGSSFGGDRAQSLEFRLDNEDMLIAKALQRPLFGWGGWGRARVFDEDGKDLTITDGLWIIALGNYGIAGLASQVAILTLPLLLLCRAVPARRWDEPEVATVAAMAVLLALYMIDNISNAMFNPIYYLAAGALLGPSAFDFGRMQSDGPAAEDRGGRLEEAWRRAEGLEDFAGRGGGDWAEAERGWRAVVDASRDGDHASPRDRAVAWGRLGYCLGRLGRGGEAIEARALAVEAWQAMAGDGEGLAGAMDDLAWALSVGDGAKQGDPGMAVGLAQGATRLAPGRPGYHTTLGAALVRDGRWSDAVVALGRSIALAPRPDAPFNHLLLAIAQAGLGDVESAREALRQAEALIIPSPGDPPEVVALRAEAEAALASAATRPGPPTT